MFPLRLIIAFHLLTITLLAMAGDPSPQDLQPRPVKFSKIKLTLKNALKELQEQSGNPIADLRTSLTNPMLSLTPGNFWPTIDAIGEQVGTGFIHQEGGGIALSDRAFRKLATSYNGIFRFTVKRVEVSRNEETQAHYCYVTVNAAWEPRFQGLYLNLEQAEAAYQGNRRPEKIERQTARSVAGANSADIDLRMPAPERKVAKLDSLTGSIRMVGVPKMLEFAVSNLEVDKVVVHEGVKVSLTYVNQKSANRWTVDLVTEYPSGAITSSLESFQQTWRDNNRVWLSWGTDPKTMKPYELEPIGQKLLGESAGTKMRFEFTARGNTPLPPAGAEVTLRYRTPNRVVAFTVPFGFQDLLLP